MPFYYTAALSHTTNGTANTESNVFRTATAASRTCSVTRILAGAQGSPVDAQVWLKLFRMSVLSTAGSAFTATPQDVAGPAHVTTIATGATTGTKVTNPNLQLAFNSRGQGHWFATNPDEAIVISAGGATSTGNIDLLSEASSTSLATRVNYTFAE